MFERRLAELGEFSRGRGGTKRDARPHGLPCVRYGDLYTKHDCVIREFDSFITPTASLNYTRLAHGDVLFAASGETHTEIGKAATFVGDEEAYGSSDMVIFRPGADADPTFIGYAVNTESAARYKARFGQGSSVIHISSTNLAGLPVFCPPLPEQRRIAEILDTLDEAIRKTEAVIAKLEQMKQGLLHDLLTRGIDENGELRDPERHPEQFKDSPLGRIPRQWEVQVLRDVAEVRSGIAKNSNRSVSDPVWVHYLRVANVQDGYLDLDEMSKIRIGRTEMARYAVQADDVLMNEGGDLDKLGRGAVWRGEYEPCVHQNHVFVVRCGPGILPDFLDAWTGAPAARRYFMITGKQTTNLASINKTSLSKLPVVVPSLREQERIVSGLHGVDSQISLECAEREKLCTLKHGLMNDLLTGRVRVRTTDSA